MNHSEKWTHPYACGREECEQSVGPCTRQALLGGVLCGLVLVPDGQVSLPGDLFSSLEPAPPSRTWVP